MDPVQQLMQLMGYPVIGASSGQAVQIAQGVQSGQISKEEATQLLQDLQAQERINHGASQLQEHLVFDQAMSGLIMLVSAMA
jgi:polyhydroxyalkanoate synthesis regulator phasin